MGKKELTGLLGVTLTIMIGFALIGCDQPNGSLPEETDTMLAAEIDAEPAVKERSVRLNRELDESLRTKLENRRLGAEERRQLSTDVLSERRARAADDTENPGARLSRERRTDRGEGLQRRESRGSWKRAGAE